jgi:hypothetical protein
VLGVLAFASNALHAQITPNPNSGLITITGYEYNRENFKNALLGTIRATGYDNTLFNTISGFISNEGGIDLDFEGSLVNEGSLQNELTGGIELTRGGDLYNFGGNILNYNNIWADGVSTTILNQRGTIQNFEKLRLQNSAIFTNRYGNFFNDGGVHVGGEIIIENLSGFGNIDGALLRNKGGGLISINGGRLANGGEIAGVQARLDNTDNSEITLTNNSTLLNDTGGRIDNRESSEIRLTIGSNMENQAGGTLVNSSGSLISFGLATSLPRSNLDNEGTLLNTGPRTKIQLITGSLTNHGGSASLTNEQGAILWNSGENIENSGGAIFTNTGQGTTLEILNQVGRSGSFLNTGNGTRLRNVDNAVIINKGEIRNESGAIIDNEASIVSDGLIENFGQFNIAATGTVTGSGAYKQQNGETRVEGSMVQGGVRIEGGVISGIGNVTSTNEPLYVGPGATIEPGGSLGTLSIFGGLTCDGCLMDIEIGLAGVDLLDITGAATFLGGDIIFSFIDDIPQVDDIFTFLSADNITGLDTMSIDFIGAPAGLDFALGSDGTLMAMSASAVPEPPVIWLLGSGLLGLIVISKRKNAA